MKGAALPADSRRVGAWLVVAMLATAILCAACASGGSAPAGAEGGAAARPAPQPGMTGMTAAGAGQAGMMDAAGNAGMTMEGMDDLSATAGPGYTVADVRFMQGMIGHHAQAVDMAAWAPTHGAGPRLLQFTQKISISQRDEIGLMRRWLAARGQDVPDDAQARGMMMPGMLTAEQMAQLEAARGPEFDRLFLVFMIQHHGGALQMVDELMKSPGAAQDSDLFRFITDVDADQRDEIYVMSVWLAEIG